MALSGSYFGIKTSTLYQALKYGIYLIILYNVVYFAVEDYNASIHRFRAGVTLLDFYDAFPQAIDSISWFVLLLMLELETWVIEDKDHTGLVRWSINIASAICYFFILLAFLGYFQKLMFVFAFTPSDIQEACTVVGSLPSYLVEIDEYAALNAESCSGVGPAPYYVNSAAGILLSGTVLNETYLLAFTEVTNSATWILVVVILWIDVFLQLRGRLTDRLYRLNAYVKAVLYFILVVAAVIWGFYGNFMDFWDAFIWIAAFVFIEMNLLQWHEENETPTEIIRSSTA